MLREIIKQRKKMRVIFLSTETLLMKLYLIRKLNYWRDEPCEVLEHEN